MANESGSEGAAVTMMSSGDAMDAQETGCMAKHTHTHGHRHSDAAQKALHPGSHGASVLPQAPATVNREEEYSGIFGAPELIMSPSSC